MCLMGIVQNLFLAYENPPLMKYIILENIFDNPDIWSLAYMLSQIWIAGFPRGGIAEISVAAEISTLHIGWKKKF